MDIPLIFVCALFSVPTEVLVAPTNMHEAPERAHPYVASLATSKMFGVSIIFDVDFDFEIV